MKIVVESLKEFIQRYWGLIICEILIVIIYVCFYTCSRDSNFEIIISPEILATLLVGIAAIYSWFVNRYDREYEKNLQMLKDIDEINAYYDGKGVYSVKEACFEHINKLEKNTAYEDTFLKTYLNYISEKIENVDVKLPGVEELKRKYAIHNQIDFKYVKYSKNYVEIAENNGVSWATWYSLSETFFKEIKDEQRVIFLTIVDQKEVAFETTGKKLCELKEKVKTRNSKRYNKVYDFYIAKNEKGCYFEIEKKLELEKYNFKDIN